MGVKWQNFLTKNLEGKVPKNLLELSDKIFGRMSSKNFANWKLIDHTCNQVTFFYKMSDSVKQKQHTRMHISLFQNKNTKIPLFIIAKISKKTFAKDHPNDYYGDCISGNILVVATVIGFLNRRNVTNMFIVSLSISDIFVILFALPFRVSTCGSTNHVLFKFF